MGTYTRALSIFLVTLSLSEHDGNGSNHIRTDKPTCIVM